MRDSNPGPQLSIPGGQPLQLLILTVVPFLGCAVELNGEVLTPDALEIRERTLLYPGNDMEVTVDVHRRPNGEFFDQVST